METLGDLYLRNERCYPEVDLFVLDEQRRTYAEFARRLRKLSSALHELGLQRQDRVGVLSSNNIEYFEICGACEWAGYIAALYNFRSAAPEIEHLIVDSAPRVVFFEKAMLPLIDAVRGRFPNMIWVCIEGSQGDWARGLDDLMATGDEAGSPERARADDKCSLFFTSGTTGKPKGVAWDHTASLIAGRTEGRVMGYEGTLLQISPAFHVGGKLPPVGAMWLGGTVVLTRNFDPGQFLKIIEKERVTHTFMVPAMMQAVMDHPEFSRDKVRSLKAVMAASTAIPVPLLKRAMDAFGPVFYVAYGSTECGSVAAMSPNDLRTEGTPEQMKRNGSVGRTQPEQDIVLLDDNCQPVAVGEVGEVCVKSFAFKGYWNNSVATIEATRSGYFHTGDLGVLDDRGYLYLVDRKKDMIISGGENIYSREVEEALHTHPAVLASAVVAKPDEKWGEVVKAYVVLRPDQTVSDADLIEHCRTRIARFKCPRDIEFIAAMPMLGTGKIDKPALRKRASEGAAG